MMIQTHATVWFAEDGQIKTWRQAVSPQRIVNKEDCDKQYPFCQQFNSLQQHPYEW